MIGIIFPAQTAQNQTLNSNSVSCRKFLGVAISYNMITSDPRDRSAMSPSHAGHNRESKDRLS